MVKSNKSVAKTTTKSKAMKTTTKSTRTKTTKRKAVYSKKLSPLQKFRKMSFRQKLVPIGSLTLGLLVTGGVLLYASNTTLSYSASARGCSKKVWAQGNADGKNGCVRAIQQILNSSGMTGDKIVDDGVFGLGTKDAVKRFQAKSGIPQDGVVNSATWTKLCLVSSKAHRSKVGCASKPIDKSGKPTSGSSNAPSTIKPSQQADVNKKSKTEGPDRNICVNSRTAYSSNGKEGVVCERSK